MKDKKDLLKIALAALILASAIPVNGQADLEADGIVLAAGCEAHGCGNSGSSYSSQQKRSSTVYQEDNRSNIHNATAGSSSDHGRSHNMQREFNTTGYESNQSDITASHATATLTEEQLLGMLNAQGRTIYLSLDSEGKALAIQLASQSSYRDKNLAIKEAQRRMNERRGSLNR